jgi:hypothetical protein
VLVTALAALTDHGPGSPSVDAWRFPRLKGPVWALASLAAGVAGSYLATSPPINEEPVREPTGRFTREREPALA